MDAPTLLWRAKLNDIEDVVMVLDEAATWLADRGIIQWPSHFNADWLRPAARAGETWLIDVDSRPAATITLSWTDPIWPDVHGAGYVHRSAVRRAAAGLGGRLLDWAQAEAQRRGRPLLRLDCVVVNQPLRDHYERAGFQHRGDIEVCGAPGQRDQPGPQTLASRYERSRRDMPNRSDHAR